jgi:rhamnulokinase
MGIESKTPIINDKALKYNITNEGGYGKMTTFLKNIMGLWIIQESRRQWQREGQEVSFAQLEVEATASEEFKCFIDPDDKMFIAPGDMPNRIIEYCKKTNQYVPKTRGEVMRCIYESLAFKYRETLESLEDIAEKKYNTIHVIGGGTKDGLLCRFTACSCNRNVIAGPIEATALGNIAVQLIAAGEIKSISEARGIISRSFEQKSYAPQDVFAWDIAFEKYKKAIKL